MARPPRFTAEMILDAASSAAVERWRDATVDDVATRLGTPSNSVYYRFPSKHALFGSLWLRAVRRFHVGYLDALAQPDAKAAAMSAAAHIPGFCRTNRSDAVALTLYRQQDLIGLVDGPLRDDVRHVNDHVLRELAGLASRLFGRSDEGTLALVAVACQEAGYGLVRRYLRSDVAMPDWVEDAARASCAAILDLGQRWDAAPPVPSSP